MTDQDNIQNNTPDNEQDGSLSDSLKNAGKSAMGVAREFSDRFQEDFKGGEEQDPGKHRLDDDRSLFEKATDFAKDAAGSAKRAAEGTWSSDEAEQAKKHFGEAVESVKDSMSSNGDKEDKPSKTQSGSMFGDKKADYTAPEDVNNDSEDIIEGEVVEEDDKG